MSEPPKCANTPRALTTPLPIAEVSGMADAIVTQSPVISRAEAKASGLDSYFTGIPCKYGHVSCRATKNAVCLECNKERGKRQYAKNPEYYKARSKKRRELHPEKVKPAVQNWRANNKDYIRDYNARWRKENQPWFEEYLAQERVKEVRLQQSRQYRLADPEKFYARTRV